MNSAIVVLGYVFTTANQGTGAPVIDRCYGLTADGRRWIGRAIHLTPWRRDEYGTRLSGLALCVGRIEGTS